MEKLRAEWDKTSSTSRILLGVLLLAAVVFLGLSFGGIIDPFGVSEGVTTVETGGEVAPAVP